MVKRPLMRKVCRGCASLPLATVVRLKLVHDPPVLLGAADFFHGVEAGEDELDAGGADGRVAGGVDLEGFVPDGRDALEPLGVVRRGQHVADFDLHALGQRSRRSRPGRALSTYSSKTSRIASAMTASSTCRSDI